LNGEVIIDIVFLITNRKQGSVQGVYKRGGFRRIVKKIQTKKCKLLLRELDDVSFIGEHTARFDEGLQPDHPLWAQFELFSCLRILCWWQPEKLSLK